MRKLFEILVGAVKWIFIALCIYILSLFFRAQRIPGEWVVSALERVAPTNLVFRLDSVSIGFVEGLHIRNFRLLDSTSPTPFEPLVAARSVSVLPLTRTIEADGLTYSRLPESYYLPGNVEKNARVDLKLPDIPHFTVLLTRPHILAVEPETLRADVLVTNSCISVDRIRLDWPDKDERMSLEGYCRVDFAEQVVKGEVTGTAKQAHIRPLLVVLDVPVSLPYMDAFTEVQGKIPVTCGWNVNLINNDFRLDLDLEPKMGKYNGVALDRAKSGLHLDVRTRGTSLNYRLSVGHLVAAGPHDEPLEGDVVVEGLNGTNTVRVTAKSGLPAAQLLKIAGFTGEYVNDSVVGDSTCELGFKFPRREVMDLAELEGHGKISLRGQIMRMKGMAGLVELMAEHVPGVSAITDTTQASCDYVIKDGWLKSDNIYIEGSVFSIKMYGGLDFVNDKLDYTARVQFAKSDSVVGKFLHPITWPFTKLLLEFKLTGSTEHPEWSYVSVIDRVLEVAR